MGLYAYRRVAGGGGATIEAPDRASAVRELVRRGETPATLEEVGAQVGSRGAGSSGASAVDARAAGGLGAPAAQASRWTMRRAMSRTEMAAFIRELLTRQDPEGYALTCEALAAAVAAPVEQLTCPSLLITGSEDGTSPAPSVRALAMRIAGSKLVIIPACGHWATLEAPSAVNDALLNFYFTT